MGKALSRIDLDIIYLDEIFRGKDFKYVEEFKELPWFPIAELLETYSENPNLRLISIRSNSDFKYAPDEMNDHKYDIIQEMIAALDDMATLIITYDNSVFEDKYAEIKMYPVADNSTNILTYVYENAAGNYVLDSIAKGEKE